MRRKELEEELDTYAQAGVSSPGVVKAARWVSRIMYLLMGLVVVIVLWTNKDAVPLKDFEAQKKIVVKVKKQYKDLEELNSILQKTAIEMSKNSLDRETESVTFVNGEIAANRAEIAVKAVLQSAEYYKLVRADWQNRLEAVGDGKSISEAERLISEAAVWPSGLRLAAIDMLPEFGRTVLTEAAINAFKKPGQESIALTVLTYLGYKDIGIADLPDDASDKLVRQMALKVGLQAKTFPQNPFNHDAKVFYLVETWIGQVLYAGDGLHPADVFILPLIKAFKAAPNENRLELLALLAEILPFDKGNADEIFFRRVATQGEDGEKLIAVRWMGNRRADSTEVITVLEGLETDKNSPIADAAKVALKRIQDSKKNE